MTLTEGYNVSKRENIGMESDKVLTLAPLCSGLNVACLLRAGVWGKRIKWSLTSTRTALGLSWDRADALGLGT